MVRLSVGIGLAHITDFRSTYTCNTDFVLKTANDANPTLWVGCDTDGVQTNFYASMPASNSAGM